jgi:crossover junction endodeoxyribonuclease RuvC
VSLNSKDPQKSGLSQTAGAPVIRILGIDPGSRMTGFGVVDLVGRQLKPVAHGTLKIMSTSGRATLSLDARLLKIHRELTQVIEQYRPQVMAVERVFFAKNAVSALKLGQARGAIILCGAIQGLDVVEYSPTEIKAGVVGHGGADKSQVARMVGILTGMKDFATSDASDAVAIAICHAQNLASRGTARALFDQGGSRAQTSLPKSGRKRLSLAEAVGMVSPSRSKSK